MQVWSVSLDVYWRYCSDQRAVGGTKGVKRRKLKCKDASGVEPSKSARKRQGQDLDTNQQRRKMRMTSRAEETRREGENGVASATDVGTLKVKR